MPVSRQRSGRHARRLLVLSAALAAGAAPALGDEVVLSNGDRLTGTIGQIAGGKMSFKSPALGDLTIELKNVTSYATDAPAEVRVKDGPTIKDQITAGDATQVTTAGGASTPLASVKVINPPPQKWTGAVVAAGSSVRGNTDTENIGVRADAVLRRDDEYRDDRFTLGAGYNYGREKGAGDAEKEKTTDNAFALAQYDKFFTEK